jgi:hypothetical protein
VGQNPRKWYRAAAVYQLDLTDLKKISLEVFPNCDGIFLCQYWQCHIHLPSLKFITGAATSANKSAPAKKASYKIKPCGHSRRRVGSGDEKLTSLFAYYKTIRRWRRRVHSLPDDARVHGLVFSAIHQLMGLDLQRAIQQIKKMSSPLERISWETNNVKRRRLFWGEGETADELTTQMTSDNISYEDRRDILEHASSFKTDDALEGSNLIVEKESKVPQEKKGNLCVRFVFCRLQMRSVPHNALESDVTQPKLNLRTRKPVTFVDVELLLV